MISSALLNETPSATPRHGNQTLLNNAQIKRKPIAPDNPLSSSVARGGGAGMACEVFKIARFLCF